MALEKWKRSKVVALEVGFGGQNIELSCVSIQRDHWVSGPSSMEGIQLPLEEEGASHFSRRKQEYKSFRSVGTTVKIS